MLYYADTTHTNIGFCICSFLLQEVYYSVFLAIQLQLLYWFGWMDFGQKFMIRCKLKIQFNRHETDTKDIMLTLRFIFHSIEYIYIFLICYVYERAFNFFFYLFILFHYIKWHFIHFGLIHVTLFDRNLHGLNCRPLL